MKRHRPKILLSEIPAKNLAFPRSFCDVERPVRAQHRALRALSLAFAPAVFLRNVAAPKPSPDASSYSRGRRPNLSGGEGRFIWAVLRRTECACGTDTKQIGAKGHFVCNIFDDLPQNSSILYRIYLGRPAAYSLRDGVLARFAAVLRANGSRDGPIRRSRPSRVR